MEGIITRCINISLLDHKLKGLLSLFGIYSRLKLVDTALPFAPLSVVGILVTGIQKEFLLRVAVLGRAFCHIST